MNFFSLVSAPFEYDLVMFKLTKTRSNNTQADIQDEVVQSEISKYLRSSDFKELLRDSFKEALSGMIV
jgi:hypothetical protein